MPARDADESAPIPIVAIGASAGGLDALKEMLGSIQADSGACYVVIQHLDPTHKSILSDLLARVTDLPIMVARDSMKVEPDHIIVIPEDATLLLDGDIVHVEHPAPPRTRRMPINTFFANVAREKAEYGLAVVLSGTGSDGTQGVKELKEAGGFIIAQEPGSAAYDSMPRNAISTGLVDKVLEPADIPAAIDGYLSHLASGSTEAELQRPDISQILARICQHLKLATGHDFRQYKEPTVIRRVRRRMQVRNIEDMDAYAMLLRDDRKEARQLFRELLISVTSFFRDPDAFEALEKAVDQMLAHKTQGENIRVWVPACATGEEAYSIAMLLRDKIERSGNQFRIQIFATDIDEAALSVARRGVYQESIAAYVPQRYLSAYFRIHENEYQVAEEIRELCIFSTQSLIKDPPFSRLDMLSCRNVLIYLKPDTQNRLIPVFHYALRPDGILLLGPSESITGNERLFEAVDKKWRLFRRRDGGDAEPRFPLMNLVGDQTLPQRIARDPPKREREGIVAAAQRVLVEELGPAYVIVGPQRELLYSGGRISRYLQLPLGTPTLDLVNVVHPMLRMDVRALWHRMTTDAREVVRERVNFDTPDDRRVLRIVARPLQEDSDGQLHYIIAFEDLGSVQKDSGEQKSVAPDTSDVEALEAELRLAKEHLQTATEELESSNEELKSANEELMSMNEELQSSNEELETSKEELQSVNEELETVNTELSSKVEELAHTNADLENILESTEIATLFLDRSARVRRFTPAAQSLFHLIRSDMGRSIGDITSRIAGVNIPDEVAHVLETLQPIQKEVHLLDGQKTFMMRLIPYRSSSDVIEGTVATFVDVTTLKTSERQINQLNTRLSAQVADLETLLDLAPIGIAFIDGPDGKRIEMNRRAQEMLGLGTHTTAPEHLGDTYAVWREGEKVADDDLPLQRAWRTGQPVHDFQAVFAGEDGTRFDMLMSAAPVKDEGGKVRRVIGIISDVTEMMNANRAAELRERSNDYVADIGRKSLSGIPAKDLIAEAPARLAEVTGVELCKILVRRAGEDDLEIAASYGFDVPPGTRIKKGRESPAGYTLLERAPVVIDDMAHDDRFAIPPLLRDAGAVSGISVIIGDPAEPMGVLGLHTRARRHFSNDDVNLVQSVANLLAAALRRDAADRQKLLLLDELRHRVKNMLATVQSVTSLSLRDAGTDPATTRSILDRLQALAAAHDLNFRHEDGHVDLRELIESQCAPYDVSRISIEGSPRVDLNPSLAIDTSMIIHELVTNAVKHGALRDDSGSIEITLRRLSDDSISGCIIEWTERGVTPNNDEQRVAGTGSRLIQALASQPEFDIQRTVNSDGLTYRVVVSP